MKDKVEQKITPNLIRLYWLAAADQLQDYNRYMQKDGEI